jgi:hypothetical protein
MKSTKDLREKHWMDGLSSEQLEYIEQQKQQDHADR